MGRSRERFEEAIAHALVSDARFVRAARVALYRAFDGEVDLRPVEAAAAAARKTLLFPRITAADGPLCFVEAHGWRETSGGLPVPEGPAVELAPTDLIVVPGVAFDNDGNRLGFGGGYYDRTLARSRAPSIGVCFECQRTPRLPHASWDVPVPALVTERGVFEFAIEECQV